MILKYAAGQGTNNRDQFYAMWILMKGAVEKGLKHLQVFGDSKLLMDWANNKCRIENLIFPIMN